MNSKLCHPKDVLITHIADPPVWIRPSVQVTSNMSNEDDLTAKLAEIIALNAVINQSIEKGLATNKMLEDWNLLQSTVA